MKSAIVPVGGEARRANGQEKYFFTYRGRTFIERLVDSLKTVVDEIILVARDPDQCLRFHEIDGVRCITDIRKGLGPVGGLHAGVLAAQGDLVFVSACDMPCINPLVVARLFDEIKEVRCGNSSVDIRICSNRSTRYIAAHHSSPTLNPTIHFRYGSW